jgi:hypothetical protein
MRVCIRDVVGIGTNDGMLFFLFVLLLNIATLLIVLVTARRVPSRSASLTVGVALLACLAAGDQVLRQRSTPAGFVMNVLLQAVVLYRLVAMRRTTRRPTPRRSAGSNGTRQESA